VCFFLLKLFLFLDIQVRDVLGVKYSYAAEVFADQSRREELYWTGADGQALPEMIAQKIPKRLITCIIAKRS
jgi:hypothetical protein